MKTRLELLVASPLIALLSMPVVVAAADGNELLADCKFYVQYLDTKVLPDSSQYFEMGIYTGLIEGVRNTMLFLDEHSACFPETGITNGQAIRIVTKYLEDNPAALHRDRTFLAMMAFTTAFACVE